VNDIAAFDSLNAKIDALARVCRQLGQENAELRSQVATLTAEQASMPVPAYAVTDSKPESPGTGFTRRAVGVAFAGAAAGIVGAAAIGDWSGRRAAGTHAEETADDATVELVADEEAASVGHASVISATLASTAPVVGGVNSSSGPGVQGSSSSGRGGVFSGGAAQIQLSPGKSSHPKSGTRGDLYADSAGRLWFCKKSGSRATWHQIA
jgi:hypothetical protein